MLSDAISQHTPGFSIIDQDFLSAVFSGLQAAPKFIPAKYLFDAKGASLAEQIARLESSFAARLEMRLLSTHSAEIASYLPDGFRLVELDAGGAAKGELLLEAMGGEGTYLPIDASSDQLQAAARRLQARFSRLKVHPLCADCERPLQIPQHAAGRTLVTLLGARLGNCEPLEATRMLRRLGRLACPGGYVLIGIDRKKDPAVLHRAYNDPEGLSAAFNLNLLTRCNRELGTDFAPEKFHHYAAYEPVRGCVEMHLVSAEAQRVKVAGHAITLEEGESIRTTRAYKYAPLELRSLARSAGLLHLQTWSDPRQWFSLMLFGCSSD